MMIFYIFVYIYAKTYCKFIYSFTPKLYVKIMSYNYLDSRPSLTLKVMNSSIILYKGSALSIVRSLQFYLELVSSVGSWGTSVFSKLLRKLLTFSWRVQSMPSTWSPEWLSQPEGHLPSNWGPFSTPCDTMSLGRSVPMVASACDVLPVLSRDNWSGMTSSWWTLSWCCIFGGHDIFLIGLRGDDERDWGWCWEKFRLWNKGLATGLVDSLESFLNGTFPPGFAGTILIISVDLALARFKEVWLLTWRELWLDVLRKRGLSSFIAGGSVTEILRRGTDNVAEDDEWSDELDGCFVSGRLRAALVPEESFLVQALSSWLFVFLSGGFPLKLLDSATKRQRARV